MRHAQAVALDRPVVDRLIRPDWLHTEKSMFDRVDQYTTESLTIFPGGRIEVRKFGWSQPIRSVWATGERCYLFNMSLSNQEPSATWTHLGSGLRKEMTGTGGLTFVPPGQPMASDFAPGHSRSLCCMIDATLVEAFLAEPPEWNWSQALLNDCAHVGDTQIPWLLRRMYREVQEPDFATPAVLEAVAKQIAIEIIRKFDLRARGKGYHSGGMTPWRMRLIRERLQIEGPLPDLQEIAALCNITVRHLTRAFRAETGQTLGRYMETVMIDRAKSMLQLRTPVGQVAQALGYSNSGAFASAFRRATGMRPSELRMNLAEHLSTRNAGNQ